MSESYNFFATCPKGLESLLLDEIKSLGAESAKETVAGVYFSGPLELAYRCCLWSRLANKVLLALVTEPCFQTDDLYQVVKSIPWEQHVDVDGSFAIDFTGKLRGINHSHFGALKAKDAIADYFMDRESRRPDVDIDQPDIRVNVRAIKGKVTVSLDLSGDSLHKRGYRVEGGRAPLKENLAAAILLRADWPGMAARGGVLIDPMCGSGTLLIEGALMAANIAPGIFRLRWGFQSWKQHDDTCWQALLAEAQTLADSSRDRQLPEIRGYDASPSVIAIAQENIDSAGLTGIVRVLRKELKDFVRPTHADINQGLVITNPPYGERLGEASSLIHLYRHLGMRLREEFEGWQAAVFTGNPDLGKQMGLKSVKQYQLFNGAIPCKLLRFDVVPEYFVNDGGKPIVPAAEQPLSEGAQMFANRLRKNHKQLGKWVKQNQHSCYRIYDADMPEYAVAVDRYGDWVHVAEYTAPAKVDADKAQKRLEEVMSAIPQALSVPPERVVLKQRRQQRGSNQYQKQRSEGRFMEVTEGQAKLLVNLTDYLDTGLFLDHRPVRLKIAELAKGQRFLNLFCYTATASVQAALGGASWTDSVDLSSTYLDWGKKNLAVNGLSETSHHMIRADCRDWIKQKVEESDIRYGLILLDPPTFSNSKKMEGTLDIQRDHVELVNDTMALLEPDGLLIFSNNQRKFKLDPALAEQYAVEDKTGWSLDKDFQRSKSIHQCWFIGHR